MTAISAIANKPAALITGSSSGIGLELARVFAANGYRPVLVARTESRLQELAQELNESHDAGCVILPADLAQPRASEEIYAALQAKGVQAQVLVNNAGFGDFGPFARTPIERSLDMIQVNITALTELTRYLLPSMLERRRGFILNVASTAAFQPGPLMAVYYASKAYVLHFSEALANELQGSGVSVTALCPGPTASGFQKQAKLESSRLVRGKRLPSSREVAEKAYYALMKGKTVYIPGFGNWALAESVRFFPRNLVTSMVRKAQEDTEKAPPNAAK